MEQQTVTELDKALDNARRLLPTGHECLACYLNRMLAGHGCTGLKWCTTYRNLRAPRATALERKFAELGGHCDCEVRANIFRTNNAMWPSVESGSVAPGSAPACRQVRLGAIKPCGLWLMRSGIQWGGGEFRPTSKAS